MNNEYDQLSTTICEIKAKEIKKGIFIRTQDMISFQKVLDFSETNGRMEIQLQKIKIKHYPTRGLSSDIVWREDFVEHRLHKAQFDDFWMPKKIEEAKTELAKLRKQLRQAKRDCNFTQAGIRGIAEDIRNLLNKYPTLKN